MDIVFFIKALLRRKWIILSCTILAVAAAFLFTLKEKKKYPATAEIATGFTMNDELNLNDQGFDIYSINLKFDNVVKTFTSPQVISLVSYSLILHDLDSPKIAFRILDPSTIRKKKITPEELVNARRTFEEKLESMQMLSSYNPNEKRLIELLTSYGYDQESLNKLVTVYRLDQTDFIDIYSVTENPLLSAFIVNNLCQEFNRFYSGYLNQRTQANVEYLDTILAQKQAILDTQQNKLNQVESGGEIDITQANIDLVRENQGKLFSSLSQYTSDSLNLEKVKSQLIQFNQAAQSLFTNNSLIVNLNSQISTLQNEYENGGSRDQGLEIRINNLKKELRDLISKTGQINLTDFPKKSDLLQQESTLEVNVQADRSDIASLQSSIRELNQNVRSSSGRDALVNVLQKEVDQARKEYNDAQNKYYNATLRNSETSGFKQILIGQPAVDPLPSHRLVTMALGGAIAFFTCIVIVVFLEYIDLSIRTPSFFTRQTGLDTLSAVNRINLKKNNLLDLISRAAPKEEKRQNTIRELIRKIRFRIEKTGHRIILFTSTEPRQGKTTLIQALAFSFSQSRKKVLLIDTNFCNNDLTMALEAKPTLENFSSNKPHLDPDDIKSLISPTKMTGVDVIGCEGGDYTPREILPRGNALNFLRDLTQIYDYIFLEAAPMNEFSDTRELMDYVDGVIAIFSSDAVIKQIDLEGINYLKSLDGRFNGAILNKVELENLDR